MKRWKSYSHWCLRTAAALATATVTLALGGGELKAQAMRFAASKTVRGTVESMTTAPRGEIDGAVLDDGTVIHWPPHLADQFASAARRGDRVKVVGWTETTPRGDTHLEVSTLTNLDTEATVENGGLAGPREMRRKGRPSAPPPPRRATIERTVQGTVERRTTAPKGEMDGVVLDDGTWLHWPPHLEDRFADIVSTGDRVKAIGFDETGPRGDEHFEVQSLTNLGTNETAENDDLRAPRDDRRGIRGEPASRPERIRRLREEVERLEREIERLERDL